MSGRSYSQDLRVRVLVSDDLSARQAAARFKVSVSYVVKARQRRDRTGEVGTRPRGSRRAPVLAAHGGAITAQVARRPSITLADLRAWLGREHGITVGLTTVWIVVRRFGLTLKNVWPAPSARVQLDGVLVCINVPGLRARALAKMGSARSRPHKDRGCQATSGTFAGRLTPATTAPSRPDGHRPRHRTRGGLARPAGRSRQRGPGAVGRWLRGPLDWLLELARARKIDLARLSIAALIDAFAAAMAAALGRREGGPMQLARWADWLVMAATLAQLRSQLLRPADAPQASLAQRQAEALRERLVVRAQAAAAAGWLARRALLGQDCFARGRPEIAGPPPGRVGDITELLRACLAALRVPEELAAACQPRPPPFWSVPDAMADMVRRLPGMPGSTGLAAFLPRVASAAPDRELRCKAALASTLLAGLELARDGTLALDQDAPWMPIQVQRRCGQGRGTISSVACKS